MYNNINMRYMSYVFIFLWYIFILSFFYVTYNYYILNPTHFFPKLINYPLVKIYSVCLIYVFHEISNRIRKFFKSKPIIEKSIDVACIIPCHNAGKTLEINLPNICKAFSSFNVYIADNGIEQDELAKEIAEKYNANYVYYSIPNKTYALLQTAIQIERTTDTKYIVLIDDDTYLEPDFYIREDILKQPLVAGYCSNIIIDNPQNILEKLVDFEYRSISYTNSLKTSIQFCHGIICVFHLRKMITIYSKLCTLPGGLPFGEDSFAGIDFRLAGYKLLHDDQNCVRTYCPNKLITCYNKRNQGFGASSLFKQRVLRWYLSWLRRIPAEVSLFLFYDTGTWIGNISYRLDIVWYFFIALVASSWLFFAIRVFMSNTWEHFGILHGILYFVNLITAYIRFSGFNKTPEQSVKWYVPFFVPFMNIIVCFMMTLSFMIAILYYIPFRRINYAETYKNAM